jgi:hypothetical protein
MLSLDVEGGVAFTPTLAVSRVSGDGRLPAFQVVLSPKQGAKVVLESIRDSQERPIEFASEDATAGALKLKVGFKAGVPVGAPYGEFLIQVVGEQEPIHLPYRIEMAAARNPVKQ